LVCSNHPFQPLKPLCPLPDKFLDFHPPQSWLGLTPHTLSSVTVNTPPSQFPSPAYIPQPSHLWLCSIDMSKLHTKHVEGPSLQGCNVTITNMVFNISSPTFEISHLLVSVQTVTTHHDKTEYSQTTPIQGITNSSNFQQEGSKITNGGN
jgi:hypothetical protein